MDTKAKEFGEYLRSLRKKRGLTLVQLKDATSISQPYLSQMENGLKGIPSPETLKKLADPLGVSHTELMIRAGHIEKLEVYDELLKIKNNEDFNEQYNVSRHLKLVINVLSDGEKFYDSLGPGMDAAYEIAESRFGKDFVLTPSSLVDLVLNVNWATLGDEYDEHDGYVFELLSFMADLAMSVEGKEAETDIFHLLKNRKIKYNGHPLNESDRERILGMLKMLFPEYAPMEQKND
ncbi:MAG: helix-turn-helix domain-containing protein [Paenibacillus macerans]|uniref:helix-turn-helix domain-containing protein n=1 Tax=Paenibacillus macerans TaxID=44252 RepID=UPI00242A5D6A|nr:helix-turn-helix transcriptional regulator [Paenibacillus macerans]MBS5910263.1 helix-turn-helix domain-containing protein [Paenibacillus macerans]MDU5945955.1 helix-turn-helix transcriptional regulator [Paenibacillus macerans]